MKIQIAALFGTLLIPILALSQSHCQKSEVVYFSCQTSQNEKVISICGSALTDEPSNNSWLQYRFGQIGKIELAYPMEKKGSIQKFEGNYFNRYDVVSLRFINGRTLYDITYSMGREDENTHEKILPGGGIGILLSKKKHLNIECKKIDYALFTGSFSQLAISLQTLNGQTDFLSDFYNKVSK